METRRRYIINPGEGVLLLKRKGTDINVEGFIQDF